MKSFLALFALLIVGAQAFSANTDINLKCEQGIGNIENPLPFMTIAGSISNIQAERELSLDEKNKLSLSVFNGKALEKIASQNFSARILRDKTKASGVITPSLAIRVMIPGFPDIVHVISGYGSPSGGEFPISLIGKSAILGRDKLVDSGLCWGNFLPVNNDW